MKFIINVRELDYPDLGSGVYVLTTDDEYEMYLSSFHQDLSKMDMFSSVHHSESAFYVETIEPISLSALSDFIEGHIKNNPSLRIALDNVVPA